MTEQRAHERFTLLFPIRVQNPSGEIAAICQDGSAGGVRITGQSGTPATELELGEAVMVSLPPGLPGSGEPIFGRVVRIEELGGAGGGREIAIEFIQPVPGLEAMFKRIAST